MQLHSLHPHPKAKKPRKRVGRGLGSKGTYSGRGSKGQRSRSGGKRGLKLMGLRKIMLSIPKKRGFRSLKAQPETVSVGGLSRVFAAGDAVTPLRLEERGLVKTAAHGVKILSEGTIVIPLQISGCTASAVARKKIEGAGGTLTP